MGLGSGYGAVGRLEPMTKYSELVSTNAAESNGFDANEVGQTAAEAARFAPYAVAPPASAFDRYRGAKRLGCLHRLYGCVCDRGDDFPVRQLHAMPSLWPPLWGGRF